MANIAAGIVTTGRLAMMKRMLSFTISHHSRLRISRKSARPVSGGAFLSIPAPSFVHNPSSHCIAFLPAASVKDRSFGDRIEKLRIRQIGHQFDGIADLGPETR
ncbi:hypothetical protein D3C87_1066740 [compost metagenome]